MKERLASKKIFLITPYSLVLIDIWTMSKFSILHLCIKMVYTYKHVIKYNFLNILISFLSFVIECMFVCCILKINHVKVYEQLILEILNQIFEQ